MGCHTHVPSYFAGSMLALRFTKRGANFCFSFFSHPTHFGHSTESVYEASLKTSNIRHIMCKISNLVKASVYTSK